nr:hypothetical protein [Mesorhizobium sp.]
MIFTASASEAVRPPWKYGAVTATLRRLGTRKTWRSLSTPVMAEIRLGHVLLAGEGNPKDAELLKQIAADIGALMACDAAIRLEQLIAMLLVRRDGVALALEMAVETGVGRDQRALKDGQGVEHIRPVGSRAVERHESPRIVRVGAQFRQQFFPARVHQPVIEQDCLVLLLDSAEIAAPVQPEIECCAEDGRRVEIELPAIRRRGTRPAVVAAEIEPVATAAGDDIAMRQPDIVEQALAKRDLRLVGRTSARYRSNRLDDRRGRLIDQGQRKWCRRCQAKRNQKPRPNLTNLLIRHRVSPW